MRKGLLLISVAAALLVGAPAYSQYVFLDVNGDGLNSKSSPAQPKDILTSAITSVDVYFVTDKNRDGGTATCVSAEPFTINSYEFTLHASGTGTVTYGAWTDNMGYTFGLVLCGDNTLCSSGPDVWIAKGSGTQSPPGKYKVGTLGVVITGTPVLDVIPGSPSLNASSQTAFGSNCDGNQLDSTIRLGDDFTDADGTDSGTPVMNKTWGQIKKLYR